MAETGTLAPMIDVVGRLIDLAARRGDGPGMNALLRRTRGLLDPPREPRTTLECERAVIDLEHEAWGFAISEFLLPAQRDDVVTVLRAEGEQEGDAPIIEDPWALLDPDRRRAWDRATTAQVLRAVHAAMAACLQYERTRRTSYLREAVLELESAVRSERREPFSGLPKAACREQGDRLERALRHALPPSAFYFFATRMREAIARVLAETNRTPAARGREQQMLSRETWMDGAHEERARGVWFVDWLQGRYEDEMERYRLAEEAEERRVMQAAEDRRERQAARHEEARLRRAEEESREPAATTEQSIPPGSSGPEERHTPEAPPPLEPQMERDYVAWPVHAEENERHNEVARQSAIAEHDQFMRERELLESREAERIRVEAEEAKRVEEFAAKARRKASPSRIQSGRWA